MKTVDFYFDYVSPFAYLASLAVPGVCERTGASLRLRPILFAGVLNHWGQLGPAEIPPKAMHMLRVCARHAKRRGVPFRSPRFHPFNPLLPLRATLAAAEVGEARRAMQALYELGWGQGRDLGDAIEVVAALERAGLDGQALAERAGASDIKVQLKTETDQAIARGVFGVPTMLVEKELLWGLDHVDDLELSLRGEDPFAGVDLAAIAPSGVGATRRR